MSRECYTLNDCVQCGQTVIVRCGCCRRRRYFHAEELMRAIGDVATRDIARKLVCSQCQTRDYLRVDIGILAAAERQAVRFTRLKEIRTVRRVIWEDE